MISDYAELKVFSVFSAFSLSFSGSFINCLVEELIMDFFSEVFDLLILVEVFSLDDGLFYVASVWTFSILGIYSGSGIGSSVCCIS